MISAENIQELKKLLLEEQKKLEENLEKIAQKTDEHYETKFEDIERTEEANADEVEQYADNLGVTDTLEKNLEEVKTALEKIKNNSYGKCENCSEEIPLERLKVYPAAKICVNCDAKK